MKVGYYVYYRIPLDQAEGVKRVVTALQEEVLKQTGVRGRLLHRRDDPTTWMEVYEGIADEQAFDASLAAAVERCAFAGVLAAGSQRITEIFRPV
jgi:quinol monooxygenase YgiN